MPEDLKVAESKNDGPRLLRAYLEFARLVMSGGFTPKIHEPKKRLDTWYLKNKVEEIARLKFPEMSFDTDALPFTDLCVRMNGTYLGAILTDDEQYLNSLSVKDVYAYSIEQLSIKNWEHGIIYSRNFWLNKEKVESDLYRIIGRQIG
jgi:hypothetical protein